MIKYELYSVDLDDTKILGKGNYPAPRGWDNEQLTIRENDDYVGFFREFSGTLGFVKDIKTWIRNIISTYGVESKVTITRYEKTWYSFSWTVTDTAILNLSNYKEDIYFINLNYEDNSVSQNLKNFEQTEIKYNSIYSLNGSVLPGNTNNFMTIRLYGLTTGGYSAYTDIYGVPPFEVFNRLWQKISNQTINCFRSLLFGRNNLTSNGFSGDYASNGYFAYWMITNGRLIRGTDPNNTDEEGVIGKTDLIIAFKKLYDYFNKKKPLCLTIEEETISGVVYYYLRIEERSYAYKNSLYSFSITSDRVDKLEVSPDPKYFFNKIKAGCRTQNNNDFGLTEFNGVAEYTTPITVFSNELNLVTEYNSAGSIIESLRRLPITGTETEKNEFDETVFIIDCYLDGSTIKSRNDSSLPTGFTTISGIYPATGTIGTDIFNTNLRARAAQAITNWLSWINVGLQKLTGSYVRFQKSEGLSKVTTLVSGDTDNVVDGANMAVDDFPAAKITGNQYNLYTHLTASERAEMKANPYKLLPVWNYILKDYAYIWPKEYSSTPLFFDTNLRGEESVDIGTLTGGYVEYADQATWGENIELCNGTYLELSQI